MDAAPTPRLARLAAHVAPAAALPPSSRQPPAQRGAVGLRVTPLATTFGARLDGVDLSAGCDEALLAAVRDALREHKVVVLPDQHHLSPAQLQAFAERFGEAETAPHPNWGDVDGHPGVKKIAVSIPEPDSPSDAIDGHWHTDGPPRPVTQWYTFLYAAQIPALGRDTLFADMEAAYSRLSPPLRHFLDGLRAVNAWDRNAPEGYLPVEHPVVMVDPETGRRSLYVNRLYTRSIVGLRKEESQMLLAYLFAQTDVPEIQLRVRWEPGTLVLWDNEKTQHYAVRDSATEREMHRVMVNTGR